MWAEALLAAVVGALVLWLVLQPLLSPSAPLRRPPEPLDPEETPRGIALTALKEIEFDRETGKLSPADYELLKSKYTAAALEALRQESAESSQGSDDVEALIAAKARALRSAAASASSDSPGLPSNIARSCPTCGPRPEPDAVFCSTCGHRLPLQGACDSCGTALLPGSRFCEACGRQVAA
jgi:hypothetical protein